MDGLADFRAAVATLRSLHTAQALELELNRLARAEDKLAAYLRTVMEQFAEIAAGAPTLADVTSFWSGVSRVWSNYGRGGLDGWCVSRGWGGFRCRTTAV